MVLRMPAPLRAVKMLVAVVLKPAAYPWRRQEAAEEVAYEETAGEAVCEEAAKEAADEPEPRWSQGSPKTRIEDKAESLIKVTEEKKKALVKKKPRAPDHPPVKAMPAMPRRSQSLVNRTRRARAVVFFKKRIEDREKKRELELKKAAEEERDRKKKRRAFWGEGPGAKRQREEGHGMIRSFSAFSNVDTKNKKCANCGRWGHIAAQCPKVQRSVSFTEGKIVLRYT
eukprot:Skav235913  [mRNA]  locus=scaffold1747:120455:121278:- [translate_table: standard]